MTELPFLRERPDAKVSTPLPYWEMRTFDDVLDARSPAEFAEDHLPDALNVPVLDDAERALVGTIYQQNSAFEAKRVGAPLAARNIAAHIEAQFASRPRNWKPLVYCWRGGGRSGALVHVLRQVGWDARRLEGGYKAFRRQVVADIGKLPARLKLHIVCGATGSGKSRLLEALVEAGAQVLDLEVLAAHRGSVLGDLPVLGGLFRYKTRSHSKTNLMIFLRPTLVRDSRRADVFTGERYDYILGEQEKTKPAHDAVLPEMKSPTLPPRTVPPTQPAPPLEIEVRPYRDEGRN